VPQPQSNKGVFNRRLKRTQLSTKATKQAAGPASGKRPVSHPDECWSTAPHIWTSGPPWR